ncbi:MAG TPA: DUF4097 family beta strand repeat-containing protein [Vicinamibacterales bacterium]|nr:DUF4097 family beta strand repeat-containing protein [Vicinamibacterales bacterium]
MRMLARRAPVVAALPVVLIATAGCDLVTAEFRHTETAEWRKTFDLQPGGRVSVGNVNGRIAVEPSEGNTVEVVAVKTAKAASPEAAKQALERIEIVDQASPDTVSVETKIRRVSSWFGSGGAQVGYTVRVPSGAVMRFTTVNGGVEVRGVDGQLTAETTNGGIVVRDITGSVEASTTNGGIDVDVLELSEAGARLECTNGGIKLRLPPTARATISASVANGGIDTGGLQLETLESSRRRLEARLNGGGPQVRIEGTNGGIRIAAR